MRPSCSTRTFLLAAHLSSLVACGDLESLFAPPVALRDAKRIWVAMKRVEPTGSTNAVHEAACPDGGTHVVERASEFEAPLVSTRRFTDCKVDGLALQGTLRTSAQTVEERWEGLNQRRVEQLQQSGSLKVSGDIEAKCDLDGRIQRTLFNGSPQATAAPADGRFCGHAMSSLLEAD